MRRFTLLTVGALFASAACGGASRTPVPAPSPTVVSVSITGLPEMLAIGQTAQLTAVATLSDGSKNQVAPVIWQCTPAFVASISPTGLITALAAGDASITATYQGVAGAGAVRVPPAQTVPTPQPVTYTIQGVVHETAPNEHVLIAGAAVVITSGSNGGQSTTTDASGRFMLANIAATHDQGSLLRVAKSGYRDASYRVLTLPRDANPEVALERVPGCGYAINPPALLSSDYVRDGRFDVVTSPGCSWTAELVDAVPAIPPPLLYGYFRFKSVTTGIGAGTVSYDAFSTYGYDPFVYTVRVAGPTGSSAIYTVAVAGR